MCALRAGITLAELYGHSETAQISVASSGHLWLVYWVVLPGLFWAPDRLGQAQALRDMDTTHSSLPIISVEPTQFTGTWRLVQPLQDKALIVKLEAKERDRQFKLVEAKDIKSIAFASTSKGQK